MITLAKLANYFEQGLNKTLNNPEIQFKIWADAGKFEVPSREDNTITHYINGNLRTTSSANDATALEMGVNGLTLEFGIPVKEPRTNAQQTAAQLAEIKDGQYPFIIYITSAINKFFQTSQVVTLPDDAGTQYSISWLSGSAITGNVDFRQDIGKSIIFTVYIDVTFVAGGVHSKLVKVYVDDSLVPIKAIRHGRSPMLEHNVCADNLTMKSIATSTAFSVDIEFPAAQKDTATKMCLDYLFDGEPNVVHFITVNFGGVKENLYLMTTNAVQTAVQGISVVGISASLIEAVDNILAYNVPDNFQAGKFLFAKSDVQSLSFTPSVDSLAHIAGKTVKLAAGVEFTVPLTPSAFIYNDEKDLYGVYLITNKAVTISAASATFEIVKEAKNG